MGNKDFDFTIPPVVIPAKAGMAVAQKLFKI
jgi:hypothetical protein